MSSLKLRIDLYILSLAVLFLLLIVLLFQLPENTVVLKIHCLLIELFKINLIPFICIFSLLYCIFIYRKFCFITTGTTELSRKCPQVVQVNYEPMTFLITFIIPIVTINNGSIRYIISTLIMLIVVGIIFIKTDLLYKNPSLVLLGFSVYKVDESNTEWGIGNDIIIICRGTISSGQYLRFITLNERVFFVRKCNDEYK